MDKDKNNIDMLTLKDLQRHAKIAYFNMSEVNVDWITVEKMEDIPEEARDCISSIKTTVDDSGEKTTEIIFHDKLHSLEVLNRFFGYYKK